MLMIWVVRMSLNYLSNTSYYRDRTMVVELHGPPYGTAVTKHTHSQSARMSGAPSVTWGRPAIPSLLIYLSVHRARP
jgi:hypothetical protein